MTTPRQASFIESLKSERVLDGAPAHVVALLERPVDELVGRQPSHLIDGLMALPRLPRTRPTVGREHLAGLIKSRYAFTWERLHTARLSHLARGDNDTAFFRVNIWRDRVYLDQLHGAHPTFVRSRLSRADEVAVADLIRAEALEAGLLFSKLHTCCARCGADLTDKLSRDTGYGPTCRGYFGL